MMKTLRIVTKELQKIKGTINKSLFQIQTFTVYWNNPWTHYWGKLEKLFRDHVDQQAEKAEFEFLHKKSGIDG